MRRLFWHWAISAVALVLAIAVLRPRVDLTHWYNAIWIAPLLGLVSLLVGFVTAIFKTVFGLVNLLTLGIMGFVFSFALYGFAVYWLGHKPDGPLVEFMPVNSVLGALLLAAVMGLFGVLLNMVIPGGRERKK